MMPRNLHRRVEILVPITDLKLKSQVRKDILDVCLEDEAKVRIMQRDGTYVRSANRDKPEALNSQSRWMGR